MHANIHKKRAVGNGNGGSMTAEYSLCLVHNNEWTKGTCVRSYSNGLTMLGQMSEKVSNLSISKEEKKNQIQIRDSAEGKRG